MIDINALQAEIEEGTLVADETATLEGHTAYQVWKQLTNVFAQLRIVREQPITPQYVYNLARQGKIRPSAKGSQTDVRYTDEEVEVFVRKMVQKNLQYRQA